MTLDKPVILKAGRLELLFDPQTAALRYLKIGGEEVLRGVYAAVRDADWGTVPFSLMNGKVEKSREGFILEFDCVHHQEGVHFAWQGRVKGDPDGTVTFSFEGEAKGTFERNRVGFCVLHPVSAAGAACVIEHASGGETEGKFPETISPHQPFKDIRSIRHRVTDDLWAEVVMEGDTFEMEDQRNWTDASFKTYCTPLERPFPVEVKAGDRVQQQVTLKLHGTLPGADKVEVMRLAVKDTSPLPTLGFGTARDPLSSRELACVKSLKPSHLRLDLDLQTDYAEQLKTKVREAGELDCSLELALHLSDDARAELLALQETLDELSHPITRLLVFYKDEKSTGRTWLELARSIFSDVPLAGGTDAFFTELNRERPPLDALDMVTYSINPQVHAFDDASLVETLAAQALTVESAEGFVDSKPVIVSPVTFKMRSNPNATGDTSLSLEQQTDERQQTLFGAAWTLGSLKHLMQTGAVSLTYFELAGPLGLMDKGRVFPLYHVFADVAPFQGGEVLRCASSHPLTFEGLALRKGGKLRVMLANFTGEAQIVELGGLSGAFSGRMLDEGTLEQATANPETFRSTSPLSFGAGSLGITLPPHALLTLDGSA